MRTLTLLAVVALSLASSPWSTAATQPIPQTMRAAAFDQGGGPEVLTIHQMPVPTPGSGEVLIAVRASAVAVWELGFREHPNPRMRFPAVLGGDGSGTIVAMGPDVHGFKVGDALGSGISALQGIDDVLQLKRGQTIIIHGASGGVGTLAIQIAKLRGARVLATASNDEGLALATKLGADAVVNGRSGDIAAAAKQFAPDGVDAVLGLAGGEGLEHCIDALRRDGQGEVAYLFGIDPLPRPRGSARMMTLYNFVAGSHELERLNKAVEQGKMHVPVGGEFSLADAAEAHKRLAAGHVLGKIALLAR